jgi:hypothetical protein
VTDIVDMLVVELVVVADVLVVLFSQRSKSVGHVLRLASS